MIDLSLRECPFCGNPAEIVDAEPFSFMPNTPTKAIRCCSEWCIGHSIKNRFQPDLKESEMGSRNEWNTRKRKNKNTWDEKWVAEQNEEELTKYDET